MENSNIQKQVIERVYYTGKTHTTGGRQGTSKSDDGKLNVLLSVPGTNGTGTNPEQLFAAGWSACFLGALGIAAKELGEVLPKETFVDAEVDLGKTGGAYFLQARLHINLPGISEDTAKNLVHIAHQTCPYSKATNGNINVTTYIL